MTESQLKLGNELIKDKEVVYDQMKDMKENISRCSRKTYNTEDSKENFDTFKQSLLQQCDLWVEKQREQLDEKFKAI